MKKTYLIAVMAAGIALNANAQKLDKPIVDKITGETVLQTKSETISNKFGLVAHGIAGSINKIKGSYVLRLSLLEGIAITALVRDGDKANIKFADGSVIDLTAISNTITDTEYSQYTTATRLNASYLLTEADVNALQSGKIAVIRVNTSKAPFDYDVSNGKSEVIKKQLDLITSK